MIFSRALVFLFLLPVLGFASDLRGVVGRCEFYSALEEKLHCGSEGYPLAFGRHYCRRFDLASGAFSTRGRAVLGRIKSCLQEELVPWGGLDCAALKTVALESHVVCYRRAEFCELSLLDQARIFVTVLPALVDPEMRRVAERIQALCR